MEYDYSEFADEKDENLLSTISTAADRVMELGDLIEAAQAKVKELVNEQMDIVDRILPALMDRAKLEDFKTQQGVKVQVGDQIKASLPVNDLEKLAAGLAWLRQNGHEAIIKTAINTEFTCGNDASARALYDELRKRNDSMTSMKSAVHHATLTSLVKELLDKGEDVPLTTLGAEVRRTAKVTLPRKRQPRA